MHHLLLAPLGFSLLAWLWGAYAIWRTRRDVPRLADDASPDPARWPTVSLIVPARDEAGEVEAALRARLAEGYPALEVVAVNDRSTDDTGAILDRLAAEDPRVRVIHLETLPAGWLGKLHAMHQGILASTGEWVLLSDADVHYAPGTLRRVLAACEAHHLDHFAALPTFRAQSPLLDAVIDVFGRNLILAGRLWQVPDPKSPVAVGGGLFNLFRREAYDRTPGLPWLKLEVADDVALAQMLKAHGARSAVYETLGRVSLDFYPSVGDYVRGVEKNFFAILGQFSMVKLTLACLVTLLVEFGWAAGLLHPSPAARAVAGLTCALMFVTSGAAARTMGRSLTRLPLVPVATVVFTYAAMRSGIVAHRRGGVAWRGTLYSIDELRAGARIRIP
ncbi:MAG: glycosyltransferase family 2 protein [Polyangiales bacterium]